MIVLLEFVGCEVVQAAVWAHRVKQDITLSYSEYLKRNGWVWVAQDKAVRDCGATILDPTQILCRQGRCYGINQLRPLYSDDDHLSEHGNKQFPEIYQNSTLHQ